jgi:hypothetical protein
MAMHTRKPVPVRWIVAIVVVWAAGLLSLSSWVFTHFTAIRVRPEFNFRLDAGITRVFGALNTFDAGNYYAIALHGYNQAGLGFRAFFPLFPFTLHYLMAPFQGWLQPETSFGLISALLNIMALCGSAILLWKIAEIDRPAKNHYWSLAFLLCFPGAYFFLAPYTESLFLLLTLGAFYAARTGRWWVAGVIGMLAATTRLPGLLLVPVLAIEYLEQRDWRFSEIKPDILYLALIPFGALAYFSYLQLALGGIATYFAGYHASWPDRHPTWNVFATALHPLTALLHHSRPKPNDMLGLLGLSIGVAYLAAFRRFRLRYSYGALIALGLLLPLASGDLESILRYVLVMFPIAILFELVAAERPRLSIGLLTLMALSNIVLMYLFVRGVFVG